MSVIVKYPTKKHIVCPTTGYEVNTTQLLVFPFCEDKERVAIWWFCAHCDDWHLLLLSELPLRSRPSMPYHLN